MQNSKTLTAGSNFNASKKQDKQEDRSISNYINR